jgi:hypothetical protein
MASVIGIVDEVPATTGAPVTLGATLVVFIGLTAGIGFGTEVPGVVIVGLV